MVWVEFMGRAYPIWGSLFRHLMGLILSGSCWLVGRNLGVAKTHRGVRAGYPLMHSPDR
jgi:hypothetical protein